MLGELESTPKEVLQNLLGGQLPLAGDQTPITPVKYSSSVLWCTAASSEHGSFIWSRMCCIRRGVGAPVHTVQHVRYLRKYESECSSNMEMGVVSSNDLAT